MTIAGLPAFSWLEMFSLCHEASGDGRVTRVSWPDGGPPLEQEEVLVGAPDRGCVLRMLIVPAVSVV